MAIVQIQNAAGSTGFSLLTSHAVTLGAPPVNGNTLIAVTGMTGGSITSIVQTGATWVNAGVAAFGSARIEIWYAQNVSGAGTGITVNHPGFSFAGTRVFEYSGLRPSGLLVDKIGTDLNTLGPGVVTQTGLAPLTTRADELWMGGIHTDAFGISINSQVPTVGMTPYPTTSIWNGWATEQIVNAIGNPFHSLTLNSSVNYAGLIVAFLGAEVAGEGESSIEFEGTGDPAIEFAAKGSASIETEGSALFKLEGPTPDEVGILEAVSSAIGEADTDIGGRRQTRLLIPLPQATALNPVLTWNGSTTVLTGDTSEAAVDDFIRLDVDGQFFKIISVVLNTSYEIENPDGLIIPSGTTSSSKAITTVFVESTYQWPDEGKVSIDGVVYRYAAKTQQSFTGITHVFKGRTIPGLLKAHNTTVVDISRIRSAIDLLRRAMLVDFAEGDDLNAIGRNLGVLRLPFLAGDDQFREIIKALAYNPRGTLYGLELALNGLVGEGNYEISENLLEFPNTVFIRLTGAASTSDVNQGKAYITATESNPATGDTTLDVMGTLVDRGAIGSVRWKDEDHQTPLQGGGNPFPTGDLITEYTGETPKAVWAIGAGHTEGVDVTFIAADGTVLEFTTAAVSIWYRHVARVVPESTARLSWLVQVPTAGTLTASYLHGLRILDAGGAGGDLGVGLRDGPSGATFRVAFADLSAGTIVGVNTVTLNRDQYYDIEVRKNGTNDVELWVDGALQFTEPYASFPGAGATHAFDWGRFVGPDSMIRVKRVQFFANTVTDYWSARGSDGTVAAVNPVLFGSGTIALVAGQDEGKKITVSGSIITNAQGGNNNGSWIIDSISSPTQASLVGPSQRDATLQAATPGRIVVDPLDLEFQFPDDLGKTIVLESGNNAGSYTIEKILDDVSFADFSAGASPVPAKSRTVEVVGAPVWITEAGIPWHLEPAYENEGSLDWELSDAGTFSQPTLTLRQALPLPAGSHRVLDVLYSVVLSAQVLVDEGIINALLQEIPNLVFSYYPFYISDPLGFVRTYLEDITAAGVIPDFIEE